MLFSAVYFLQSVFDLVSVLAARVEVVVGVILSFLCVVNVFSDVLYVDVFGPIPEKAAKELRRG